MILGILLLCIPGAWQPRAALEEARAKVAELINAEGPETIIFTAGATEANNLAIRGACAEERSQGQEAPGQQHRAHLRAQSPEGSEEGRL